MMFQGTDLLDLPPRRMRDIRGRDIAMIFQEPTSSLNPVMTIGAQIGEAILLHETIGRNARRAKAIEMLRLVGIPDPVGRYDAYPHQFSGGMRQRVGIARVLGLDPSFIVADEQVSALDVSIQAQIINLMQDLPKKKQFSFVFIAHDLAVVRHIANRVAVMYLGRIIPQGEIPSPTDTPSGCAFRTRCPLAAEICARQRPPLAAVGGGHSAACHFARLFPIGNS